MYSLFLSITACEHYYFYKTTSGLDVVYKCIGFFTNLKIIKGQQGVFMPASKDCTSYSTSSKIFHWLIALIVMPMVVFSFFIGDLPKPIIGTSVQLHKSFGLLVLFLMIFRVLIIIRNGKPSLSDTIPVWQRMAARLVQYSLYIALFTMPLIGWVMSTAAGKTPVFFWLFKLPLPGIPADKVLAKNMFFMHQIFAWIIISLLVLHIAAALKHHYINKDNVLRRMLFLKK